MGSVLAHPDAEDTMLNKNSGAAWAPLLSFWPNLCIQIFASVRGQRRGILLNRRLGAHRGLGWLRLLLVPLDRVRLAHKRAHKHLIHARDRNDVEALLDALV